ncbi:tape measure domain-containing protein [Muricomes intestini]|uniref:Tape measure domain-containing protein n=1 Tax=Muricomes intestini TaxID=1796634 RepID=A0A4R3K6S5_9FIRM|nr:tape measure protein [Muricomes intestini]TCS78540.1 tape measure domain-containing protein [Muricomes intestini]
MGDYSVKAILSATDNGFLSTMKSAMGYTNNLKSTLTSGLGFGIMMGAGQKAFSAISGGLTGLIGDMSSAGATWKTFEGNMRMSGHAEADIKSVKKELSDFAVQTIYNSSDMASTFAQLDAVGTKNTTSLVKGFGGLAAAADDPKQAMKTLSQQATQMAAKPTVAWQDFKLMLEQTPSGISQVAKTMGMSTSDLVKNVQDGKIATEDFFDAIEKTGTNAHFSELATQYKKVSEAADGLKETMQNKLQPAFDVLSGVGIKAISKITDSFDSINEDALAGKVTAMVTKVTPYWDAFKDSAIKVKDAFGDAFGAIGDSLGKLTGKFGSDDSVDKFSGTVEKAAGALKRFAGFLEDHSDIIAKVLSKLPQLLIAYKGFKVVKSIAPGLGLFAKGITSLAGKGIGAIAGKLFGIAGAQKTVGTASTTSAGGVMKSAVAFLAMGAGVLLITAGIGLLVYSAIQLAQAGPMAAVALLGLVAVVALFAVGAAALGPALTAGAVGFIAFGAAIALVGVGALLASVALTLVAGVLPTVVAYGSQGAGAIALLGAGMIAFAAGAAIAGVACVVLGAGLLVVGVALALVGVGVLVVAAGVMLLAAGTMVLGAGMMLTGAALMVVAGALPTVAAGALASTVAFAAMLAVSLLLGASLLLISVPLLLIGPAFLLASVGALAFGVAMTGGAVGCAAMAVSLKLVNSSMKSIASNAKAAETSISSMRKSVNIVNDGLDALGNKAKSAINKFTSAFQNGAGQAQSAATTMANGVTNGTKAGLAPLPSVATSAMSRFNSALRAGGNAAVSLMRSTASFIVSTASSAASGMYGVGYNIGAGLASGMSASLGYVESVASQLASAAERAVRARAKIHSPSRVFAKLGTFVGQGFANGIESMQSTIERVSNNMVAIPDVPAFAGMDSYSFGSQELRSDYEYRPVVYVNAEVTSVMDGREVGYGTAKYVEEKNNFDTTRKNRIGGKTNV